MAIDHTNCDHPRTPAGRRACRARRAAQPAAPVPVAPTVTTPARVVVVDRADRAAVADWRAGRAPVTTPARRANRPMHDCRHCGFAHEATEEWCGAMGAELDRAAATAERGGKKVRHSTNGAGSTPATGLMERHAEPITLRKAEGRPAPAPVVRQATENQVAWITTLVADRDVPEDVVTEVTEWLANDDRPIGDASTWIDRLKAFPFPPRRTTPAQVDLPDVPAGSYAIDGSDDAENSIMFVEVWRGRTGFVKVYHQTGPNRTQMAWAAVPGILARIEAAGVREAMERYGLELGVCGRCHRPLTNDDSRARGIGPVCASKLGW